MRCIPKKFMPHGYPSFHIAVKKRYLNKEFGYSHLVFGHRLIQRNKHYTSQFFDHKIKKQVLLPSHISLEKFMLLTPVPVKSLMSQ